MTDWIDTIISAWIGHRQFAEWLVQTTKPRVIVELGVDYGFSTFVFANAVKQNNYDTTVYGIDMFEGDIHTGIRNTYNQVIENKRMNNLDCLEIIVDDFEAASKIWTMPIDILHIDGLHTYEAVKTDFENWHKFVKDDGIILFHDVTSFSDTVGRFFNSIDESHGHKTFFTHSAGLGILTKNTELFEMIKNKYNI